MGLWFRLIAMLGSAREAKVAVGQAREKLQALKATAEGFQTASFQRTRERAQNGQAEAQYQLGEHYYDGRVAIQDYQEAFQWFLKAAQQRHVKAQLNVGLMYSIGRGVEKNPVEAEAWLKRAAAQGDTSAEEALKKLKQREPS